ncbi:MAG: enoyl-CoA hydratase-related protein [Solirubrobacterales bacterium]
MAFEVRLERRGRTAIITIDNPPVNALHPDVAAAIGERVAEVGEDRELRALILTGAGRHFMAGGDIEFFKTLDRSRAERYVLGVQRMQDDLATLPQPVIAALNGTTLGGGCELAMACDIRVAEQQVKLGQPEVSLGLIPGAGGTQALPRLVPLGLAKRLLFTGERIDAEEGLRIGLVDEVVPTGGALERALEIAELIGRNAPLAVTAAKRAVTLGMQMSLLDGNRVEAALFSSLAETRDLDEGVRAFFEKREPRFGAD